MIKLSPFQWSSFNFFGFYCAYGVLLPFLPVWLNYHGYETGIIGTLIALGYLFRFSGSLFFSKSVTHPNQLLSLNRLITWATVLTLIAIAYWVETFWLLLPTIVLFNLLNGGSMPIADTIASTWQQQVGLDYGKTRLFGSIGFVIGSVSTGYFVGWWGEDIIIISLIGWLVFLGIGISFNPTHYFELENKKEVNQSQGYWQLLKQPSTFRMMLAISLIQASHAAYYAYSTIYWQSQGIETQNASLLWGIAVIAEIIFFFFSKKLFKDWKIQHLMIISALATMIRWGLLAVTTEFFILVMTQTLHALTFGMGHYAMIRYISSQPTEQIAKLQALYFGCASCVVMALFTFIAGILYQTSPTLSFWIMVVFALPAIFIVPKKA